MTKEQIRTNAVRHLWICALSVAALHVALIVVCKCFEVKEISIYTKASSWAVAFSFVELFVVVNIWKWIASSHLDYLPTYHTAVSGFRMLLVLIILGIITVAVGRDNVMPYAVAFLAYYAVLLILHSVFFAKMTNKLFIKQ